MGLGTGGIRGVIGGSDGIRPEFGACMEGFSCLTISVFPVFS